MSPPIRRNDKSRLSAIGFITKLQDKKSLNLTQRLIKELKSSRAVEKIYLEEAALAQIPKKQGVLKASISKMMKSLKLVVVVGGDGTILRSTRYLLHGSSWKTCHILGVNTGRLGFLSCVSPLSAKTELLNVLKNPSSWHSEERSCLSVSIYRRRKLFKSFHVMNDCVLSKGSLSRIFEFHINLNAHPLSSYRADGVIISPPTGSTAYNLAAGGAIIQPGIPAIQITPICPQYFSNQPILVADENVISVKLGKHSTDVFITLDGQTGLRMNDGDEIRITRSAKKVKFLVPSSIAKTHYFDSLRQKLNWGLVSAKST